MHVRAYRYGVQTVVALQNNYLQIGSVGANDNRGFENDVVFEGSPGVGDSSCLFMAL